jgi:surface antigen
MAGSARAPVQQTLGFCELVDEMKLHIFRQFGLALLALGTLAACNGSGNAPEPAARAPADPFATGVVMGPLGKSLTEADRKTAGKAQYTAISTRKRLSWRGKGGSFGYIVPGAVSGGAGGCREYSHTIYINGRPGTGKGKACQIGPDSWKIES